MCKHMPPSVTEIIRGKKEIQQVGRVDFLEDVILILATAIETMTDVIWFVGIFRSRAKWVFKSYKKFSKIWTTQMLTRAVCIPTKLYFIQKFKKTNSEKWSYIRVCQSYILLRRKSWSGHLIPLFCSQRFH